METRRYVIHFEKSTPAEANQLAADLREHLLDEVDDIMVEQRREDDNAMDAGTTLVLALGAPATVIAAKALWTWLRARGTPAPFVIETLGPDGKTVTARASLSSNDARAVIENALK